MPTVKRTIARERPTGPAHLYLWPNGYPIRACNWIAPLESRLTTAPAVTCANCLHKPSVFAREYEV